MGNFPQRCELLRTFLVRQRNYFLNIWRFSDLLYGTSDATFEGGDCVVTDSHSTNAAACGHRERPGLGWIFVVFALMALVLLWQEHRAHLLGVIPYLILFACPLMHLLHHRGHGHNSRREEDHHA